ncbi:UNVERIFIED_CONTAM: Serine/threonine-protein phosphatase 7 long form [Sesamum radiatum]|uniref:Serine/threonine-protein phosphatase 7 long form n=1 Tax=Sesamum radiatum TaxID=300843 RepID=A0AAW2KIZ4_SESRA
MDRRAVYGPRDGTVLSQQSQHRSDEILDGDIDEVLQAKRADGKFWRNLREQDLPIRVQQILHQIGFYGVYRCGRIQYDCHLITALVERWRSETHSFHFRVGEATITLQDVQVIWGLPIDGEPVSGTDLERTSVQWQEYCMQYIGFAPEEGALKGSRLQVKAIIDHISHVHITPDTPHLTVVHEKGKAAIGGALQLVQIWAWSRIIPLCPGLGAPRVHMGPHQIDNNRVLPGAPYGAMWNCEHTFTRTVRTTVRVIRDILDEMQYDQFIWQPYDMESNVIMAYAGNFNPQLWRSICPLIFYAIVEMHHPERVLRQFGMMQNIPDQPDTRDMSCIRSPVPIVRAQIGFCSTSSTSLDGKDDMTRSYKDNPFPTEEIQIEDIGNDVEGYRQLVAQLEHEVQIIAEAIKHQPQQTATPSNSAPTTSHRQRRSSSQMSIGSVERGDIGVDIAGPSTAYTPQDYYVPQPPQDYYVPQPSQDDWFQSTSYMPSHAEAYSSHVDLDLGLGINQPYAPEYNISQFHFHHLVHIVIIWSPVLQHHQVGCILIPVVMIMMDKMSQYKIWAKK